jgi:hypothetical protein
MRLRAIREFDGSSGRILRQRVRIDSAGTTFGSFGAARSAEDFVTKGFAGDSAGTQVYFGPDAEVLLNDGFAAGYCFHVMNPDRSRRNQVGLGFLPADARVGRVDVDGALWIDTVARALVDIEFRYLNLDPRLAVFVPGGRIAFRGMPNGVVVIDRWSIRVYDMEVSGELARAEWPDGVTWQGRLGTLHLRALHGDGTPAAGTRVRLIGTDYTGIVDSVGSVEITDLIPGPYTASLVEPQLAEIGIANSGGYGFMAARATTNLARVAVLPAQEYVDQRCGAATVGIGETIGTSTSSAALLGRVTSSVDGKPVANARWTLRYQDALGDRRIIRDAEVGSDGVFQYCLLRRGASVVLDFRAKGMANATVSVAMTKQPTVVNVTMRPRP